MFNRIWFNNFISISLFVFILFVIPISAQSYNWISTYYPGGTFAFHSSVTDGQGNTYVAYYSWDESTQINKLGVVKHNGQGSIVWDVMIENSGYSDDIKLFYSEDDKLYAWVNDNIYIYSPEGELISSFVASYYNHSELFVNSDGEVIITYFGVEHDGSIQGLGAAKFNTAGLLVWDNVYREVTANNGNIIDTEIDSEGNIYLLGMDNTNAVLIKSGSNGIELWEKQINYGKVNDLEIGYDNSLYIAGRGYTSNNMCLSRFDQEGELSWTRDFSAEVGNGQYMKLLKSNSGVYAAGYHSVPYLANVLYLKHYSANGDLLLEYVQEDPGVVPQISYYGADYGFEIIYNGDVYVSCLFFTNNKFYYGLVKINSIGELAGYSYVEGTNYGLSCLTYNSYLYGGGITLICTEPTENGSNNGLLKIINYSTGITSVSDEELQTNFSLSQNYPNPFNPTTRIKYSLPKLTNVTLKIFSVMGEEIITLVNKVQSAGLYEVDFNGAGLASGIYFYHLETDSFHETKKMILLK